MSESLLDELQDRLGYRFRNQALLEVSLTHSSAVEAEQPRRAEQLEFLGDAVVGLVLSDLLLREYPDATEGKLSKYRAALVNTASLAAKTRALNLNAALQLGKGEEKTGGRNKASILAAVYEAVVGAVFLEAGFGVAHAMIASHFASDIATVAARQSIDAKTELQEVCQSRYRVTPTYRTVMQVGPDHARWFVVDVMLSGAVLARGEGQSKRLAEQDAARRALLLAGEMFQASTRSPS
jgi:ribonuclease III